MKKTLRFLGELVIGTTLLLGTASCQKEEAANEATETANLSEGEKMAAKFIAALNELYNSGLLILNQKTQSLGEEEQQKAQKYMEAHQNEITKKVMPKKAQNIANAKACEINLKKISIAIILFCGDNRDVLPSKDKFYEQILPYIDEKEKTLVCPASGQKYIYLANGQNIASIADPVSTVLVTEEISHDGRFFVVCADGHVVSIRGTTWKEAIKNNNYKLP